MTSSRDFARMHNDYLDPDKHLWQDEGCEVCQTHVDNCTCEECPKCGASGDPECYGGSCSGISKDPLPTYEGVNRLMASFLDHEMDREGPSGWNKSAYKGTDCGAWLEVDSPTSIAIGSIVEGCEECAETQHLEWPFTSEELWGALQKVEDDCNRIWKETHGCEQCAKLHGGVTEWGEEMEYGNTPVHPDCPECQGDGIVI